MNQSSIVVGIVLAGWFSLGYAQDYEVADFGDRTPTSTELVEALKPLPAPKVRGIVMHGGGMGGSSGLQGLSQGMPMLPEKPKAVSMQIQFNYNSAQLTPDSKAKLDVVAAALSSADLANYKFKIEGHTDSVGSAAYNLKLSQRRAQSVANYVSQRYGVKLNRLQTVGKGMNEPVNAVDPKATENRRVVVVNAGSL